MNDEVVAKFIIDNIATYEMLNTFTQIDLSTNVNILLVNAINNFDIKEKEKFESKQARKENVSIGIDDSTINDLKNDFTCSIKDKKIVISKYVGNYEDVIIFPANVEGVNDYLFKGLIKSNTIKKIIFEEGIKNIYIDKVSAIFSKCECLEEVYLPKSLEHIDEQILINLPEFTIVKVQQSIYNSKKNFIYKENKLVSVNEKNKIINLVIPEGTTDIADNLFYSSKQLKSVDFPKSIQRIGESSFSRCRFNKVTFPEALDGELTIEKEAFSKSNLFYSLKFPKGLKSVKELAFNECKGCSFSELPNTVEFIGEAAFQECRSLYKIKIPSSVEVLSFSAFADCTSASYIVLEEGVKQIKNNAFYNCRSVRSLELPSTIEELGNDILSLTNLSTLKVSSENKLYSSIDNALLSKDGTVLIKLAPKYSNDTYIVPASVTTISNFAFSYCKKITKVVIPSSVENIKECAFSANADYKLYTSLKQKPDGWNVPQNLVVWGSEE